MFNRSTSLQAIVIAAVLAAMLRSAEVSSFLHVFTREYLSNDGILAVHDVLVLYY